MIDGSDYLARQLLYFQYYIFLLAKLNQNKVLNSVKL